MPELHPELIGAIVAGIVTCTLAVIAALRQKKSPYLTTLNHVDGLSPSEVRREIVVTELRAEVAELRRNLESCERRGILMMERLIRRDGLDGND